ncbi:MAG TPA: AMP-binding protein, partial [Acidimicrobiia bacterium]|nr:AMP-binding protein [Acidimicrobiia bacterium]
LVNDPAAVQTYLALSRVGATHVPMNTRLTRSDLEYILRDANARYLVTDPAFLDEARELRTRLGTLEWIIITAGPSETIGQPVDREWSAVDLMDTGDETIELPHVADESPATIMYTSGTTGFPKGVVRSHRANLWNVVNSALGSPRTPTDVEVFTLPIFGIGFMHFVMPALLAGATVVVDHSFEPKRTWRLIEDSEATRVFLAPTMLDSMLRVSTDVRSDVSKLEIVYTAYEFPARLRTEALEVFGDIFVYMYGLTEAQLTCGQPGEFAASPTSVGKAMGLMRVRILDDLGHEVPPGSVGEIALEGPALMTGYHGLPEATAEVLSDGWLRTGDLGYLAADSNLHYTGRKKEMIKSGGYSVDPFEVERAILTLERIREAVVVGLPDEHWGEAVVAVVSPPGVATEEQLREHCKDRLADFKVPKRVIFLDELPKNATGKYERGKIRDIGSTGSGASDATMP